MDYEGNNLRIANTNGNQVAKAVEVATNAAKVVMNVEPEMEHVVGMTPKDGYQKKLELISNAPDMSTREKIAAIDAAEDKYANDIARNTHLVNETRWSKTGTVVVSIVVILIAASTPTGRNIGKAILKAVA